MRLKITFSGAWMLGFVALTARLFVGLGVDQPNLYISGWMSALFGVLLCLPMLWAGTLFSRSSGAVAPVSALESAVGALPVAIVKTILLLILLWDAAGVAIFVTDAMDYATILNIRKTYFLIPLCLALFLALLTNGEGISGAARLWLWLFPWFFVLVILQRFKSYDFRWLTPLFGAGAAPIANGSIAAAGWLAPAIALWLIAEPNENTAHSKRNMILMVVCATLLTVLLLLLRNAMTPAQVGGAVTRISQLDSIISNGRASLSTQLPMLVIWFAGQLNALVFDLFLSATLLQRLIPRLDGRLCALIAIVLAGAVAWLGYAEQKSMLLLASWEYLLISIPFFVLMGIVFFKRQKEAKTS